MRSLCIGARLREISLQEDVKDDGRTEGRDGYYFGAVYDHEVNQILARAFVLKKDYLKFSGIIEQR